MSSLTNTISGLFRVRSESDRVRDYLNQSVSISDLERRQREVDAWRSRERRYPF